MKEEEKTGKAIAKLLNHSLNDITPGTLYRLQTARRAALEHYQPAEKMLHAGVGISIQGGHHWFSAHAGRLILTASLLLFLAIHSYWQMNNRIEDTGLTPVILINDLSIESQEIEDTVNDYEAAGEDTVEETISRKNADNSEYDGKTDTSETEVDANDTAGSDNITDSLDSTEIQDTENTDEPLHAAGDDQQSAIEEDTEITSEHLQNSKNTADSHDTKNTQDSIDTINE